ncbi:uncharacterized protein LOC131658952 [Vicia villosa]|uniref:uncharacterized protein LOC131658952 n=1 Tax=Vicia villosa TaxID=3911 RepID=UPI00273CE701|nr:uncharacterized protein LOC131658952 [Vicia villosa]
MKRNFGKLLLKYITNGVSYQTTRNILKWLFMILREGSDIHVNVPPMYRQSFDSLFVVNDTYTIANFQVQQNDLLFKPFAHNNNTITITLWEAYAVQFINYIEQQVDTSTPVVILIQYAKVKEAFGKYPLSVTNTYNVTKVAINEDLETIKQLSKLLTQDTIMAVSGLRSQQSQGRYGWYYQACHECPNKVTGDKPPYKCTKGHETETAIFRYKIEVDVVHAGTKCKFVL